MAENSPNGAVDALPPLWTRNFTICAAANFLLFFSFYQLLPILPIYVLEKFRTDDATAGLVISLYTIGALAYRPFAGFLVDTLDRKPLYFRTFLAFTLCFAGYRALGVLPLLAALRFALGLFFGIASTASNTGARLHDDEDFTDPEELEKAFRGKADLLVSCGEIAVNPTNVVRLVDGVAEVIRGEL